MKRLDGLAVLLWLAPLLICIPLFNIARDLGRPFGGFINSRFVHDEVWRVDVATPPWWPGLAMPSSVQPLDVILAIDGQPADFRQREVFAEAQRRGRAVIAVLILDPRSGQVQERHAPIVPFTWADFLDYRLPDLILFASFWLLALVLYRSQPEDQLSRSTAFMFCVVGLARIMVPNSVFMDRGWLQWFAEIVNWMVLLPLLGPVLVNFALRYPIPSRWLSPGRVTGLFTFSVFIGLMRGVTMWLGESPDERLAASARFAGVWTRDISVYAFLAGVLVVTLRVVWVGLHPGVSRRRRRQAWIFTAGALCALPSLLIISLVSLGSLSQFHLSHLDTRYLLLAVPVAMTYSILRYRVFRRAPPMFLGVFIIVASAVLASLSAWVVKVLYEPSLARPLFVPFFVLALGLSLIWSTQTQWQSSLGRLFHWEQRSYSAVQRFGERVIRERRFTQLPDDLTNALVAELELECAAVWLWQPGSVGHFQLAAQAGRWEAPLPAAFEPSPGEFGTNPVHLAAGEAPAWLQALRGCGAEVAAPLWALEQPVGLLGLGQRSDEEVFDQRDLEITRLIAQQSALFLFAAQQVDELRQVPRRVAEAQERERFKIAQELHDAIQQFLGRLPFYLEVSREAARTNPAETDALLRECIADVKTAAQTVRQIRSNLAPRLLESGLVRPLEDLIARFQARTRLTADLELAPDLDGALSPDARHALYRVVQQALDNVEQHAQARRVTIQVQGAASRLDFVIADDGQGFSPAETQTASLDDHFGLRSMGARISALGGELRIASAPGSGTRLVGWLPRQSKIPG